MFGALDSIRVSADCPRCGAVVVGTYGQVRTFGVLGCSCGAMLKVLEGALEVEAVQWLIDEQEPPAAAND